MAKNAKLGLDLEANTGRASAAFKKFGKSGKKSLSGLEKASKQFSLAFKGAIALFASKQLLDSFVSVTKAASGFETSLVEINTILPETSRDTEKLSNDLLKLQSQFGGSAQAQAKAFYNIVSAGITDTTEAQEVLTRANELSIAGIGDLEQTIDVLTSSLNVYGDAGLTAAQASDILFTTVKKGKTTLPELSASLAKALPIAKQIGVGFEDVAGAVASLTASGIKTPEAVTGINALFASIIQGQERAAKAGEEVAKAFSFENLQQKGLVEYLNDVNDVIGDDSAGLLKILGTREALISFYNLTANGSQRLSEALDANKNSAGASADAFELVNATFAQQSKVFASLFEQIKITFGNEFISSFAGDFSILNKAIEKALPSIKDFASVVGPAFASGFKIIIKLALQAVISVDNVITGIGNIFTALFITFEKTKRGIGSFFDFISLGYVKVKIEALKFTKFLFKNANQLASFFGKNDIFKGAAESAEKSIGAIEKQFSSLQQKQLNQAEQSKILVDDLTSDIAKSLEKNADFKIVIDNLKEAIDGGNVEEAGFKAGETFKEAFESTAKKITVNIDQNLSQGFTKKISEFFNDAKKLTFEGLKSAGDFLGLDFNEEEFAGLGGKIGDQIIAGSKTGGKEAGEQAGIGIAQESGKALAASFGGPIAGEIFGIFSNLSLLNDEEIETFIDGLVSGFIKLVEVLAEKAPVIINALVDSLITDGGIVKIAVALVKGLVGAIGGLSVALLKLLGEGLISIFRGLGNIFQNIFGDFVNNFLSAISSIPIAIFDAIVEGAGAIFDAVSDALSFDLGGGGFGLGGDKGLLGGGIIPGFLNQGGVVGVSGYNNGGSIQQIPGSGNSDSVPLFATPGEVIIKKDAVGSFDQYVVDLARENLGRGNNENQTPIMIQVSLGDEILEERILRLNQNNARLA